MKKELSGKLTYVYKFILPFVWTGLVIFASLSIYNMNGEKWTFLLLFVMLLPMLMVFKPKFISYDDSHIYISSGRTKRMFDITNLKSINEPYNFTDPFFEIELYDDDGQTVKFEGRLLELKNKIQTSRFE
jgi:hypothetical protein